MLKDNFSISQTRKTLTKFSSVITVVSLFLLMQVPGLIFVPLFSSVLLKDNISLDKPGNIMSAIDSEKFLLFNLFLTIFVALLAYLFARYYQKRNNESLGLTNKNKIKNYLKGAIVGILMILVVVFALKISGIAEISLNISNVTWPVFFVFVIGWMIQGFEEELITRSILMNYFSVTNGVIEGILINSLIFAILHIGNPGFGILPFINIFLIGIVFSLLFYISDDIFLSAAAHSIWNFGQGNIFGINVSGMTGIKDTIYKTNLSGNPILTGGFFGFEGSIFVTLVEIIVIFILIRTIKNRNLYVGKNQ